MNRQEIEEQLKAAIHTGDKTRALLLLESLNNLEYIRILKETVKDLE